MTSYEDDLYKKIIDLPVVTKLDLNPNRVLEKAKGNLTGVVILGYDEEGEEYFASSYADGKEVLWLIERLKKKLINVVDEYEEY